MKFGPTFGVGFHTYFHQGIGLNVELRDSWRSSIRRAAISNGDGLANNDDLAWTHTWMVGANLVVFLPFERQGLSLSNNSSTGVVVPTPKKKVTLYFSSGMLDETQREAIRQDRSISWIIQAAWRIARDEVQRLPGYGKQDVAGAEPLDSTVSVSKRQIDSL